MNKSFHLWKEHLEMGGIHGKQEKKVSWDVAVQKCRTLGQLQDQASRAWS